MLGKVSVQEAVEDALDQLETDFDDMKERKRLVNALVGAFGLLLDQERTDALEAVKPYPRAADALRKLWKLDRSS